MTPTLIIAHTWDGVPLPPHEHAVVQLSDEGAYLGVRVLAPFHGDAPPPHPAGSTPQLWEHEVVECFIAGQGTAYLEVELAPAGHHLVLRLSDRRQVAEQGMPLAYEAQSGQAWWTGFAKVPKSWCPPGPWRVNAYRIHGSGSQRRYLASTPLPGPAPDFHQPMHFQAVPAVGPADLNAARSQFRPSEQATDCGGGSTSMAWLQLVEPHGGTVTDG